MQRTTSVTVGLLFALSLALVLILGRGAGAPEKVHPPLSARSAAPSALPSPPPIAPAAAPSTVQETSSQNPFDTLPDGRSVPELPESAPKTVSFGAVLVTYHGAQSAPADARSKLEARKKALDLVDEAKRDFAAAAAQGDLGSSANLGRIPRGILEPAVEYLLFSLEKGSVHPEPIDTPRGYWLVRRND